jgi:hypothetical protein
MLTLSLSDRRGDFQPDHSRPWVGELLFRRWRRCVVVSNAPDNAEFSINTEGALQMQTAPSAGAQSLVSLWQNDLIGIRGERQCN